MAVTPTKVALIVFTACNMARVFACLPQIVKISCDTQGVTAISYATWTLFGVSHLSTVAYAVLVVDDWRMAVVFAANTLCCVIIMSLTTSKAIAAATPGLPLIGCITEGPRQAGLPELPELASLRLWSIPLLFPLARGTCQSRVSFPHSPGRRRASGLIVGVRRVHGCIEVIGLNPVMRIRVSTSKTPDW